VKLNDRNPPVEENERATSSDGSAVALDDNRNGLAQTPTNGAAVEPLVLEAATQAPATVEAKVDNFGAGIGMFHAFRYGDYRWLWIGNTFSSAAMWVQQTTMGWVAYDLTGSGALLGAINSVRNLPTVFAAPVAGLAADRYSRNTVIASSQLFLFLNAILLAAALEFHVLHAWHLFAFAIIAGTLNAFNQPARQTMVFDVVPREAAPNAIALNSIANNMMRSVGPMLGGGLIVFFGPANNFLVQAMAYLCVMVTALMVRRFPPRLTPSRRRSFFGDMADGYKWAAKNPNARLLVFMMILYPTFVIPVHTLMPIFTKEVFLAGAGGLGLLLSALGVGGLFGGFIAASVNKSDRRGMLQLGALLVLGAFLAAFAVVGHMNGNLWVGAVLLVLCGTGGSLFNTINQTVLQLVAPDAMRGRVTGLLNVQPIFQTFGLVLTGIAADAFGPAAAGTVDGMILVVIGLAILIFSPRMRDLRLTRLGERLEAP
jgi:MFS family permease